MSTPPCTVETCIDETAILRPVPLCLPHAIETALAILPTALAEALTDSRETNETEPTEETVVPTEIERTALAALRVTGTAITRRSVERSIRSLGGRCATDRATVLARWARNGSDLTLFNHSHTT